MTSNNIHDTKDEVKIIFAENTIGGLSAVQVDHKNNTDSLNSVLVT